VEDEGGSFLHASAVVLNVKETIVGLIPGIHLGKGCSRRECGLVILTGTIASGWVTCGIHGNREKLVCS